MLFFLSLDKNNTRLKLPELKINEKEIQRTNCIRFLGVLFDENLTWNNPMHLIENKISGILYKAKYTENQYGLRNL